MDKENRPIEDWEIALSVEYFECVKKAIKLVEERKLIGWRTGKLIDALADMYHQNADCEENIELTIAHIRGDIRSFDKYCL